MSKKKNNFNEEAREIFVYAEISEFEGEKKFHPVVFELLSEARRLAKDFKGGIKVSAVICANIEDALRESDTKELYKFGADKIYYVKNEKIASYMGIAEGITKLADEKKPEIFLIGATILGRTIAPLISSKLDTGLTADCTRLEITDFKDEKKLAPSRPTFGGQLMATILCKKRPQMATVRPFVLLKGDEIYKEDGEFEEFTPDLGDFSDPITVLGVEVNKNKLSSNLENAKIVVAGGLGLKGDENFNKLKKFASLIGAAVAGSRGAVDKGLIGKEFQIGQTGKTISPKVYMAFGISGAVHHLAGISNAEKIIAINTDKNAPIFENSDIGIVEDASIVLDSLIAKLEGRI